MTLKMRDMKGSSIWQKQYQANAGMNTLQIDNIGAIPDGLYLLQWFDGSKPESLKLLVRH